MSTEIKPQVKLIGADSNAFNIISLCITAAKKAGWSKESIANFRKEAMAGDFDHLLRTCMDKFDVTEDEPEDDFDENYDPDSDYDDDEDVSCEDDDD